MTNFDFLKKEPQFNSFSDVAIMAEKIIHIDVASCIINCRRAMEFAIKWMYSVDKSLKMPYKDNLDALMKTREFRDIVDNALWKRLDFIRKAGNAAVHEKETASEKEAKLCLENLFVFMDFIACCYSKKYVKREYDASLLEEKAELMEAISEIPDLDLKALIAKNEPLKEQMTARREEQKKAYVPKPFELTEHETRKIYIDTMLIDAGWKKGKDWRNEVPVPGMPNKSEEDRADYILYDSANNPLAIIEAKKTSEDVSGGRKQAELFADKLEKKYKRRPIIFLTNGFDTHIIDNQYPEREVAAIYSKRDLEKLFRLRSNQKSLDKISINRKIADRYYQEEAIRAVCDSLGNKNQRKVLLAMATGSGKTRTVIGLCDVLFSKGCVKNILFLAERDSLVTQAARSFENLLPDLSVTSLGGKKVNYDAQCVFSTYQEIEDSIDAAADKEGKLFTCGHFDLVICDEAHFSIYNKYEDVFTYFDAPLVGLTSTPKDEIDKNTYEIFELEEGTPTYVYELSQAVKDGYLVDYQIVQTELEFIDKGTKYSELSEEDKEEYESTFENEDGKLPDKLESSAFNAWIFNEDTIKKAFDILMSEGIKLQQGKTLGKTVIFAKNHKHAKKLQDIFNKEYPKLKDYAKIIDDQVKDVQKVIDDFSKPDKLPRIAISVDTMDTGIDVPEVLNLVFLKNVKSKAKFWQMIGRGTRPCKGLLDGEDKQSFYIFDFCGNFEFFRMNSERPVAKALTLQGAIFNLKFELAYKLQGIDYQKKELIEYRKELVKDMADTVKGLDRENFAVRQHIKYVDLYANEDSYNELTQEDIVTVREELAPLIVSGDGNLKKDILSLEVKSNNKQ